MPVKRTHGKVIIFSAVNSKLLFKVVEREEFMSGIKILVIFSMRTFDFAVMSGSVGTNKFVPYATLFEASLKQCGRRPIGGQ